MTQYVVYLLHFEPAFRHARHYVGITQETRLRERLNEHRALKGARLTTAALLNGSLIYLARTWPNATFELEQHIKRSAHKIQLCPICSPSIDVQVETGYQGIGVRRDPTVAKERPPLVQWPQPRQRRTPPRQRRGED